jgi:S-adenosylmethionine:tRNA ribosyltransferase-isomerase
MIICGTNLEGVVQELLPDGKAKVTLFFQGDIDDTLAACGKVALPPYIRRPDNDSPQDRERYQTIYANRTGAVAAPTAGLHFSESLLKKIAAHNVKTAAVTLHVGYGTFAPVRVADIRQHTLHEEYAVIPQAQPTTAACRPRRAGAISISIRATGSG